MLFKFDFVVRRLFVCIYSRSLVGGGFFIFWWGGCFSLFIGLGGVKLV